MNRCRKSNKIKKVKPFNLSLTWKYRRVKSKTTKNNKKLSIIYRKKHKKSYKNQNKTLNKI